MGNDEPLYFDMGNNIELFFGKLWPEKVMTISIEDGMDEDSECFECKINKEQAIQIISHLQKEFSI